MTVSDNGEVTKASSNTLGSGTLSGQEVGSGIEGGQVLGTGTTPKTSDTTAETGETTTETGANKPNARRLGSMPKEPPPGFAGRNPNLGDGSSAEPSEPPLPPVGHRFEGTIQNENEGSQEIFFDTTPDDEGNQKGTVGSETTVASKTTVAPKTSVEPETTGVPETSVTAPGSGIESPLVTGQEAETSDSTEPLTPAEEESLREKDGSLMDFSMQLNRTKQQRGNAGAGSRVDTPAAQERVTGLDGQPEQEENNPTLFQFESGVTGDVQVIKQPKRDINATSQTTDREEVKPPSSMELPFALLANHLLWIPIHSVGCRIYLRHEHYARMKENLVNDGNMIRVSEQKFTSVANETLFEKIRVTHTLLKNAMKLNSTTRNQDANNRDLLLAEWIEIRELVNAFAQHEKETLGQYENKGNLLGGGLRSIVEDILNEFLPPGPKQNTTNVEGRTSTPSTVVRQKRELDTARDSSYFTFDKRRRITATLPSFI